MPVEPENAEQKKAWLCPEARPFQGERRACTGRWKELDQSAGAQWSEIAEGPWSSDGGQAGGRRVQSMDHKSAPEGGLLPVESCGHSFLVYFQLLLLHWLFLNSQ